MVSARIYDAMYRWWAPWDAVGVRDELRDLLATGEVMPTTHPRALDLGCGTGANVVELAARGFDATGVDLSTVALAKARERARDADVTAGCRFVQADLTATGLAEVLDEPFDLVVDFGTLDDLRGTARRAMATNVARLVRPGGTGLLWCFQGARATLPWISFHGPSKLTPGLEPGEEERLLGRWFDLEVFSQPHPHVVCFRLRRHADDVQPDPPSGNVATAS